MRFNTPSKYMRDAFMFNLLRIFLETEKNVWCNATVDLLSGTIFVFDTDTQVYGQSRKQQMLQPQGVNTGICQMDTPSVAFLCTSNGWRQIHRHTANAYKLVWCCSGKQILIRRYSDDNSVLSNGDSDEKFCSVYLVYIYISLCVCVCVYIHI